MHDDDIPMPKKERHGLDGDIEKQCEQCRYFAPQGDGEQGECRRHAPAPHGIRHRSQMDDDTLGVESWWPTVSSGDWCGEFEPIDGSNW
jgi:hypothetical protein